MRHKTRLVIKAYEQELDVDFDETWACVAKLTSLRMVLALGAKYGLMLHHMDVTTAFLNPRIDSLVFMDLPPGTDWLDPAACIDSGMSVCRLLKALYGLKQAPHLWFKDIDSYLQSIGFKHSSADPNLFTHTTMQVILLLYVDDILITSITEALETIKSLHGYTDSDWAGDVDDRKSTALSPTKAEYVAASEAAKEAIWLRCLFY